MTNFEDLFSNFCSFVINYNQIETFIIHSLIPHWWGIFTIFCKYVWFFNQIDTAILKTCVGDDFWAFISEFFWFYNQVQSNWYRNTKRTCWWYFFVMTSLRNTTLLHWGSGQKKIPSSATAIPPRTWQHRS